MTNLTSDEREVMRLKVLARFPNSTPIPSRTSLVEIAWPLAAWWRLSRKWTTVVYAGVFVATVLVQAGVR